jgi:hypothetical protein
MRIGKTRKLNDVGNDLYHKSGVSIQIVYRDTSSTIPYGGKTAGCGRRLARERLLSYRGA